MEYQMGILKSLRSFLYRKFSILRKIWHYLSFYKHNGYFYSLRKPITYNEKVQLRKSSPQNPLFSTCADKLAVKSWVAEKGFADIVIENYFSGSEISFDTLKDIIRDKGDVLLKANHNSGPVYLLTTSCDDKQIRKACDDVNKQLKVDYGKLKNEPWYSDIIPQVLVEKRLSPEKGDKDLKDFKFHVFRQENGELHIILHIDFDRSTFHHRSFFDVKGNWLPFGVKYPTLITAITLPKNYNRMVEIVKNLASEFSYARVDLYNINGNIYFGELTFAHGGGGEAFSSETYDMWFGYLWQLDPRV
jgi:hypothetical protein